MKLVGLMPVRNEDWCLGLSLRVALLWCDEVVVLLHACTDGSGAIVAQVTARERERVRIIVDDDPTWKEMEHRQQMLAHARIRGATHIAMIDADEILTGNLLPDRHGLDSNQGSSWDWYPRISHGNILQLPGYNLRGCVDRHAYVNRKARLCGIDERLYHYHQNGVWGNRWFSTAFQDDPRLGWSGDRFHAREPQGIPLQSYRPIRQRQGGVMHLWGCSERRQRAHHAWYKLTERLRWPDKPTRTIDQTYSLWRSPADSAAMYPAQTEWAQPWTFSDVPEAWWKPYAHLMRHLDLDAVPWQIQECRRLYAEHGPEMFTGLDLFGVC